MYTQMSSNLIQREKRISICTMEFAYLFLKQAEPRKRCRSGRFRQAVEPETLGSQANQIKDPGALNNSVDLQPALW